MYCILFIINSNNLRKFKKIKSFFLVWPSNLYCERPQDGRNCSLVFTGVFVNKSVHAMSQTASRAL